MRPIERKVLSKITDTGITFDGIMEIIDSTPMSELKKSFPDDCLFQSVRNFSKLIVDNMLRSRLIIQEGNKYTKPQLKKENEKANLE